MGESRSGPGLLEASVAYKATCTFNSSPLNDRQRVLERSKHQYQRLMDNFVNTCNQKLHCLEEKPRMDQEGKQQHAIVDL